MKIMQKLKKLIPTVLLVLLLLPNMSTYAIENNWTEMASMSDDRTSFQTEVIGGKIYAIGGSGSSGVTSSAELYDPSTDSWANIDSMSVDRYLFETEVIDGKIYAIGGSSSSGTLSSSELYDPATDSWTTLASMSSARYGLQTAVIDGKIYAIGGYNSSGALSSMEVYDPTTNSWTTRASMGTARRFFHAFVQDGYIYAIGGFSHITSAERYSPATNTWTSLSPMPYGAAYSSSQIVDGNIYIIGGNGTSPDYNTFVYNCATDTWTTLPSMLNNRYHLETAVLDGKIYAFGGVYANYVPATEVFDPALGTWTTLNSMSVARRDFCSEVVDGVIYAFGGEGASGYLSSVEAYGAESPDPTLSITPSVSSVEVGETFTTTVAIHNATNICAEDILVSFDASLMNFEGATAVTGQEICYEDTSTEGTVRLINACQGSSHAATGDADLVVLTFMPKAEGTGIIDITAGRIANNSTLEMDVIEENCGQTSVTVSGYLDVNRNGEFSLIDLGIDAWYYGMSEEDTDTDNYDTDIVDNNIIDTNDLKNIVKCILFNLLYSLI